MNEFLESDERTISFAEYSLLREYPLWEGLDQWLPQVEEL